MLTSCKSMDAGGFTCAPRMAVGGIAGCLVYYKPASVGGRDPMMRAASGSDRALRRLRRRWEEAVPRGGGRALPARQSLDLIQERAQSLRITLASMGDGVIATDDKAASLSEPFRAGADRLVAEDAVGRPFSEVGRILTASRARPARTRGEGAGNRHKVSLANPGLVTRTASTATSRQRPRRSATPGGNRGRRAASAPSPSATSCKQQPGSPEGAAPGG